MIKNSKKAVTLSSLVIYIVLFTTFTIFATNISSNMNERLFNDRGAAINYATLNKLQYNINDSSLNSTDVSVLDGKVIYSNGDSYSYDSVNKLVLKNGGILCQNVESFTVTLEEGKAEEVTTTKKLTILVSFNKYLNTMTRTVVTCVEV